MTGPGDRYRIQARTGEFTFLGHDRHRGRDVVLRRIPAPPELPGDERRALTLRSVRRARAASRLAHPAINPVLDAHADGDDAWLVCEPIDGRPLAETVAAEGPLPPHRVRALALDLLGALAAGHSAGLLHLDVQPATVWLTSGGRAVLTGYGAALPERFTPGTSPGRAITPPGAVPDGAPGAGGGRSVGTPGFTAPECLGGTGPVPASDLWSLAATLYFAIEGQPAFAGAGLAAVSAVLSSEPQPPARAGRLAPVLLGLLAKDPAQRPDALSARAAFEAAAGNGPGRTVRVGGRLLALGAAGLTLAVAAPAVALTIALTPPAPHVPAPVASPAPANAGCPS
ncbi:protein kinase domain-containing protein, partial [Nonomuraea sp. SBT364]|uniref:protein kinase domain-containing protein n=1 Tax=Nonomuraea sp. SBT364 TaxID=1580530 RepID=UPI00066E1CA4